MDYITCNHTKSRYRVSVEICSVCKRMRMCADYRSYLQPSLFPEALNAKGITKAMFRKRNKQRTTNLNPSEPPYKPEQLLLNI